MEKLQKWFGLLGILWPLFIMLPFLLEDGPKVTHVGVGGTECVSKSCAFSPEIKRSTLWIPPKLSMVSSKASTPDSTSIWESLRTSFFTSADSLYTAEKKVYVKNGEDLNIY